MRAFLRRAILLTLFSLWLVSPATASKPKMVGVNEDAARQSTTVGALKPMGLASQAGYGIVRETVTWVPGQLAPSPADLLALQNSIVAATLQGLKICLEVLPATYTADHHPPPLTPTARQHFSVLLATVANQLLTSNQPVDCWFIGNEPNNPFFWKPQFAPDGTDSAAAAYEKLLALSYDTLKKVSPANLVGGGELTSRGNDDPHAKRPSLSPVKFLQDMGLAYRKSGRERPIMDIYAHHPYGINSSESPAIEHPNSTMIGVADYPRLVESLHLAFDFPGSAQKGADLPICYCEYGVESLIPGPQQYRYSGQEPATSGAVDETTHAEYYRLYYELAACQKHVVWVFNFHVLDERKKRNWQSALYYSDGSPKSSLPAVSAAIAAVQNGTIDCNDG